LNQERSFGSGNVAKLDEESGTGVNMLATCFRCEGMNASGKQICKSGQRLLAGLNSLSPVCFQKSSQIQRAINQGLASGFLEVKLNASLLLCQIWCALLPRGQ
jgi:hypothetical protein